MNRMENSVIAPITPGSMRNETHVQFGETVNALITGTGIGISGMEALYKLFVEALGREKEALDFMRKSEHTEQISEQDRVRDRVFRGFADAVRGLTNHYEEAIRADAGKVWSVLAIYGNIAKKPLDDETAAISDLLTKLAAPGTKEALGRIKMTEWAAKLGEENSRFQTLMMERYGETSGKTPYRMKTARKETDRYYRAMVSELDNIVLKGLATPEIHRFIDGLNAIVVRFDHIATQEKGRGVAATPPLSGSADH